MVIPSPQRTPECKRCIKRFCVDPRDPLKHHDHCDFHPGRGDNGGNREPHRCVEDKCHDNRRRGGDNWNRGDRDGRGKDNSHNSRCAT